MQEKNLVEILLQMLDALNDNLHIIKSKHNLIKFVAPLILQSAVENYIILSNMITKNTLAKQIY